MYEKIIELIDNAKSYNILHTNLRLIYDELEFTDENMKLKRLLIEYCSDIVISARCGKMIKNDNNADSKKALIDYCKQKSMEMVS